MPDSAAASSPSEIGPNRDAATHRTAGRAAVLRMYVLLSVLAALLSTLWYDYRVARIGVERAYTAVGALNDSKNGAPEHFVTTRTDVRQAIGRVPSRVFQEGSVTIEEYGWPAGFPIEFRGLYSESPEVALRTHSYYAVYFGARLSTHYKFYLPLDEIRVIQTSSRNSASVVTRVEDAAQYYEMAERHMPRSEEASDDAGSPLSLAERELGSEGAAATDEATEAAAESDALRRNLGTK